MKTWRLTPKHKNSFHETEAWTKGKLELIHDVVWQTGSFTIESDTKPEIDLVNKEGLDPDNMNMVMSLNLKNQVVVRVNIPTQKD